MDKELKKEILDSLGNTVRQEGESKEDYRKRIKKAVNNECQMFAISVQKGGVGKTVISSNLAYLLAEKGFKVLLMDCDPQSSLSQLLGCVPDEESEEAENPGLYELFEEIMDGHRLTKSFVDSIIRTPTYTEFETKRVTKNGKRMIERVPHEVPFGFDFISSDISLADVEIELPLKLGPNSGFAMMMITNFIKQNYDYDYIIADTCPGLGQIVFSTIFASNFLVIPLQLEFFCVQGVKNLIDVTAQIQEISLKKGIKHHGALGIVVNEFIPRSRRQREVNETIKQFIPIERFKSSIPSREQCDISHLYGRLFSFDSKEAYEAFDVLADEIINRGVKVMNEEEVRIIRKEDLGKMFEDFDEVNE